MHLPEITDCTRDERQIDFELCAHLTFCDFIELVRKRGNLCAVHRLARPLCRPRNFEAGFCAVHRSSVFHVLLYELQELLLGSAYGLSDRAPSGVGTASAGDGVGWSVKYKWAVTAANSSGETPCAVIPVSSRVLS
jgi:hypothetical protein